MGVKFCTSDRTCWFCKRGSLCFKRLTTVPYSYIAFKLLLWKFDCNGGPAAAGAPVLEFSESLLPESALVAPCLIF
jgi:hypothetical protein